MFAVNVVALFSRAIVIFALIFVSHFSSANTYTENDLIPPTVYSQMIKSAPGLNPKVLNLSINAIQCAINNGALPADKLTVIDYSLASTQPRLWVFDLASGKLLFNELVAHGKNSGENYARRFSNQTGSLQSSLGLFQTKETYQGSNGYSLRMEGLDQGFNDEAMNRAIVFHGAPYVNATHVKKFGRIGRSWGCPAVNAGIAKKVIDTIKGEQFLFSYYPDKRWLTLSTLLHCRTEKILASNHNIKKFSFL